MLSFAGITAAYGYAGLVGSLLSGSAGPGFIQASTYAAIVGRVRFPEGIIFVVIYVGLW